MIFTFCFFESLEMSNINTLGWRLDIHKSLTFVNVTQNSISNGLFLNVFNAFLVFLRQMQ